MKPFVLERIVRKDGRRPRVVVILRLRQETSSSPLFSKIPWSQQPVNRYWSYMFASREEFIKELPHLQTFRRPLVLVWVVPLVDGRARMRSTPGLQEEAGCLLTRLLKQRSRVLAANPQRDTRSFMCSKEGQQAAETTVVQAAMYRATICMCVCVDIYIYR